MLRRVRGPIPENQIDPAIARDSELTWERIVNKPSVFFQDSGWINLSLNSGWSLLSVNRPARCRKIGQTVLVEGYISVSVNFSDYGFPLVLPTGFRPAQIAGFIAPRFLTNGGVTTCHIAISPSGALGVSSLSANEAVQLSLSFVAVD
ncbi:hypothetical protein NG798_00570 [Ancylothrix sp. C2]|uniref:hypothetical protein n=1 Tax=Ancylothrix sp. D3o TaxID=2953691 RepID=UPI0021BB3920|nr:hypothetical protein [Ancylothrix sp. D3o]MCT7948286.1 hypothetical protein [Ancylothrix sp. D3o]